MVTEPMPATWPALTLDDRIIDRLRTLWRPTTTDDQRYHLENLAVDLVDVQAEAVQRWAT